MESTSQKGLFRFIDLFAGIGGFHHAMHRAGGQCVLACEMDEACRKVYSHSFPELPQERFISNIRTLTRAVVDDESTLRTDNEISKLVPDHELLCAGFPCQPFSKSGFQKGFRDKTRGTLFFDILQIVRAKKPKYLFLENVRNLAGPRHTETWATIVDALREEGYSVRAEPLVMTPHLIPPANGGAPQVRERVFILGTRGDDGGRLQAIADYADRARAKELWNPDHWNVRDILLPDASIPSIERYFISPDEEMYLEAFEDFVKVIPSDSLPGFPIWVFAFLDDPALTEKMPDWERDFRVKNSQFYRDHRDEIEKWRRKKWGSKKLTVDEFPFSRQKFEWQARKQHSVRKGRTLRDLVVQFRPSGLRVKPPTYLPALVAITQTSVIGPALREGGQRFRKLTPLEASRLQGLPDFVYRNPVVDEKAAYKQLGNGVNSGLIRLVGSMLLGIEPIPLQQSQQRLQLRGGAGKARRSA